MKLTLESAISAFGAQTKAKLGNFAVKGQPEYQIRAPFEQLLEQFAQLCNFQQGSVAAVGESSVSDLKTRPDYAISVHNALVGFIELKAPGKGADPRKFKDPHDMRNGTSSIRFQISSTRTVIPSACGRTANW
jgi:hypothetical protein